MKNLKIQKEFKEKGVDIQVMIASHTAYTLLVSCYRLRAV